MFWRLRAWACRCVDRVVDGMEKSVRELTRPRRSIFLGTASDLVRGRKDLVVENALLRQQLIVVRRQVERPRLLRHERAVMVALAAMTRAWRESVLLVKPDTVLRWHRHGFRLRAERGLREGQASPSRFSEGFTITIERRRDAGSTR